MSKAILLATFVLLHFWSCLFEIFRHFNLQYFFHLIPYDFFIELLKLKPHNSKREVQNTNQEMNLPLAITQLEDKLENFSKISDNNLPQNFEDDEFEITKEVDSIINNIQNTAEFSTGMNETRSSKKLSSVT
ncbi:hypothetical protein TNCT_473711 [Trichonephila clavata]|uniref:Uncharacterized protein n=1 Tax=Trichonephila clavata TaxID=2740835 RepID=A0A8X6HB55_TRICU|nr:hypothetical protein TNCT_473711 [Trichonephila clavata]